MTKTSLYFSQIVALVPKILLNSVIQIQKSDSTFFQFIVKLKAIQGNISSKIMYILKRETDEKNNITGFDLEL